jgi:hypothetical protein
VPGPGLGVAGSPGAFTAIGSGSLGGKAAGLRAARDVLARRPAELHFDRLDIGVPAATVIATSAYDTFLARNDLSAVLREGPPDRVLAHAFQQAELPAELVGDLWELARGVRVPLAVRSSSLLEDALRHPFAGVYATKMIPNNQPDPETRFRRLVEAVKFVYASASFREARGYVKAAGCDPRDEKMAVLVQEVVGRRHGPRFYPDLSAVARSHDYYPVGDVDPAGGVADLALGLGKTIVDGERAWTLSPLRPAAPAPFASAGDLVRRTQTRFWAVNMGPPPPYDPVAETEYLVRGTLEEAELDGTLREAASTYDPRSDRIVPGLGPAGPRVIDFAPLLRHGTWPVAPALRGLLSLFRDATGSDVEMELAATFGTGDPPPRLAFLQVRPMAAPCGEVEVTLADLDGPDVVVAAERVMGNGALDGVRDVVFVRPSTFDRARTRQVAADVAQVNGRLAEAGRPYLLIGFGRWGSSDPWLGIPVAWADVAGARVIVEAALPSFDVEASQGAHFFHNLLGFQVPYVSVSLAAPSRVDWSWLESLPAAWETPLVRHVETRAPLRIRVDGRRRRAVVLRPEGR